MIITQYLILKASKIYFYSLQLGPLWMTTWDWCAIDEIVYLLNYTNLSMPKLLLHYYTCFQLKKQE